MADQLDLIQSTIDDVPQANNLAILIRLVESVHEEERSISDLSESLAVDERTVRYYIDLARWLGLVSVPEPDVIRQTSVGSIFGKNVQARSRLFRDGLFLQDLVQSLHALKRDDESLTTKDAAERVILARTDLAPSTAKRRASSLSALLEAAYKPSSFDWKTGEKLEGETSPVVSFEGRAFLTAMAARAFGASSKIAIGFPTQVSAFVKGEPLSNVWKKSSLDAAGLTWFGSVPINETTTAAAKRGGRDLRNLLALCVPSVSLTVGLLNWKDAAGRAIAYLSDDMYGVRVWVRGRDYGSPIDLLKMFCLENNLQWHDSPERAAKDPFCEPASNRDLLDLLLETRFCHRDGTKIHLVRQFEFESREHAEGTSSTHDRLELLEPCWRDLFTNTT